MSFKAFIGSVNDKYSSLADRVSESYQENIRPWNHRLEELAYHPIRYVKSVFTDLKTDTKIKRDLASTLSILPIITPAYATIETLLGDLSTSVSLKSRAISTILTYVGFCLGMEGREKEHKKHGITKETPFRERALVDMGYAAKVIFPVKIGIYAFSGETDMIKIMLNSTMVTIIGCLTAPYLLRLTDCFRDFVGVDDTGALPEKIKQKSRQFRRNAVLAYFSAGALITAGVYALAQK